MSVEIDQNKATIESFYTAFAKSDAAGMTQQYADDVIFEDPAFGQLKGQDAKDMWHLLMGRSQGGMKLTFDNVSATANTATAQWKAVYPYGPQKRIVTNLVTAQFELKDGKITKHTDDFDLWKWSSQALGVAGKLLGWSSFMRNKIQEQTGKLLKDYQAKK